MSETLSVVELLSALDSAVTSAFPGTVWVRGEVSGFKRTNRGAGFFRLVDPETPDHSIDVAARGKVMHAIERDLEDAGVGSLRSGIEIRLRATVGLRRGHSLVQLSLLEVDPAFIAGRLALNRDEILRKLEADGSLLANRKLEIPLVPLRIGLVTSRGSAAHADFLKQLGKPGYRFKVLTVEATMQGETSAENVERALGRLASERLDLVAVVRGGGSKLDLASFDSERVGRMISRMPFPVLTGIGHETDRSVADEAAAVALKTPTAAAEWIVARVGEYAGRIEIASQSIRDLARDSVARTRIRLDRTAAQVAATRGSLTQQEDLLENLGSGVVDAARSILSRNRELLDSYAQMVATVGIEPTLKRGFAVVSRLDGSPVRAAASLVSGEKVIVRMADGKVGMTVEEKL